MFSLRKGKLVANAQSCLVMDNIVGSAERRKLSLKLQLWWQWRGTSNQTMTRGNVGIDFVRILGRIGILSLVARGANSPAANLVNEAVTQDGSEF